MNKAKNVKEAINRIEKHYGVMRVRGYLCTTHNKIHKYSFHSCITFCPGTERFYGVDTAKELIKLANSIKL